MNSKIRFTVPKQNEIFSIAIVLHRPELEMKLDKTAISFPQEYKNVRFGMIEKDQTINEIEKLLFSFKALKISKLKILGLITCKVETQYLEQLTEHKNIKFIDLAF